MDFKNSVDVPGIVGVTTFYIIISLTSYIIAFKRHWLIAIWRKITGSKKTEAKLQRQSSARNTILDEADDGVAKKRDNNAFSGRNLGFVMGTFTLTAGWVGGGYISGTAEMIYRAGIVMTTAPFGYSLSLLIGGFLFGKKLREKSYMTMIDPLQDRYGEKLGAALLAVAFLAETFWSLSILITLGISLSVILSINYSIAVIIATIVAVLVSILGGMRFLVYVDTIQLTVALIALWMSLPFILTNSKVENISQNFYKWSGVQNFNNLNIIVILEDYALLILGGIPWQTYFQKILACKNNKVVYQVSFSSCFMCLLVTVPAIIIGAAASCADWSGFQIDKSHFNNKTLLPLADYIFPLSMTHLLPPAMTFFALGSITAAALSSTQSSLLGAGTMISENFFKTFIRPNATEKTLAWCSRISMIIIGGIAIGFSFLSSSVYELWYFSSDLVYIILFPRLICAVYVNYSNVYGGFFGFIISLILRLLFGVDLFRIKQILKLPPYHPDLGYIFPGRTLCMVLGIALDCAISYLFYYMFITKRINKKYDIFGMLNAKDYKTRKEMCSQSTELEAPIKPSDEMD